MNDSMISDIGKTSKITANDIYAESIFKQTGSIDRHSPPATQRQMHMLNRSQEEIVVHHR